MSDRKHPESNKFLNRLVPYMWPWSNPNGGFYPSIKSWLWSRKFSLFYVLAILSINLIFGFAPRKNCWEGEWHVVFQCNWMMWMGEFRANFWHFIATSFTTIWFHNDFVHILFVIIFGFAFPVQSFEAQHGTKKTIVIYFASYLLIGLFMGSLFSVLLDIWPNEPLVQEGFARAWMGGSVGIFALIAALGYYSKKNRLFMFFLVFVFELINHFLLGNNVYISFIHISSATFGLLIIWVWDKLENKKKVSFQLQHAN